MTAALPAVPTPVVVAVPPVAAVVADPSPPPASTAMAVVPVQVTGSSQVSTSAGSAGGSVVDGVRLADAARGEVYICLRGASGFAFEGGGEGEDLER